MKAEGLVLIEEARATADTFEDLLYDSDLHRIQGELLLALDSPRPGEAEEAFRKGVEIARRQEAKSFELKAATSLGHLLRDTGRSDEAQNLLREVYGWFTEGFDTADLKEAKALLEELEKEAGG